MLDSQRTRARVPQIHEWSLDDAWLRDAGFDELVLLSARISEPLPIIPGPR